MQTDLDGDDEASPSPSNTKQTLDDKYEQLLQVLCTRVPVSRVSKPWPICPRLRSCLQIMIEGDGDLSAVPEGFFEGPRRNSCHGPGPVRRISYVWPLIPVDVGVTWQGCPRRRLSA